MRELKMCNECKLYFGNINAHYGYGHKMPIAKAFTKIREKYPYGMAYTELMDVLKIKSTGGVGHIYDLIKRSEYYHKKNGTFYYVPSGDIRDYKIYNRQLIKIVENAPTVISMEE